MYVPDRISPNVKEERPLVVSPIHATPIFPEYCALPVVENGEDSWVSITSLISAMTS
ncbi:hypothetical protein ACR77J_05265 [Tissierella praeacuta]|uniref:hypothetical protein n=1 Tax=Tissierella praeacuta TaxID=43131 RepID=UPI0013566738|nr:hypothetical protein [Tissierella praeacuta]